MDTDEKLLKEMFESAVHVGHRTQKWNPKMKKYLYGELSGLHIIDLTKTLACFNEALAFMSKTISEGKAILFVSTKPQSVKLMQQACLTLI